MNRRKFIQNTSIATAGVTILNFPVFGQNPYEGELVSQAYLKYGKHIQMGNQRRSMPTLMEAAKLVQQGAIGKAYFGKAWYTNNRQSIGIGKKVPVPPTLDFELWQGPA